MKESDTGWRFDEGLKLIQVSLACVERIASFLQLNYRRNKVQNADEYIDIQDRYTRTPAKNFVKFERYEPDATALRPSIFVLDNCIILAYPEPDLTLTQLLTQMDQV